MMSVQNGRHRQRIQYTVQRQIEFDMVRRERDRREESLREVLPKSECMQKVKRVLL